MNLSENEQQTIKCEATGQTIARRFARFTDGHLVSVQTYNTVAMERFNFILTLADIKETLEKLDTYHTTIRKFVLWTSKNTEGTSMKEKIAKMIVAQDKQTVEHFKKSLFSITREEHLLLMSTYPLKDILWDSDSQSQSAILDAVYKYTKYFSINNGVI